MASGVVAAELQDQLLPMKTKEVQTGSDIDVSSESSSDDEQEKNEETTDDSDSSDDEDMRRDEAESVSDTSDSSDDNDNQQQGQSDTSSTESSDEESPVTLIERQRPSTANSETQTQTTSATPSEVQSTQTSPRGKQTPPPQEQTNQPDVISTDSQTQPLETNESASQTSPRKEQTQSIQTDLMSTEDADKQRQETITPTVPVPADVERTEIQKSGNTLATAHPTSHSEETTAIIVPTRLSFPDTKNTPELKSIECQTSVNTTTVDSQTTPINVISMESQTSPRQIVDREVANVQQQANMVRPSSAPSRRVGIQTKPVLKPVDNALTVTKEAKDVQTATRRIKTYETDSQTKDQETKNKKCQTESQVDIFPNLVDRDKLDRPITKPIVSSSNHCQARTPSPSEIDKAEEVARPPSPVPPESSASEEDRQLLPPKPPEPRKKKKLSPDQKRDLALIRRIVHPPKISPKPKKHPSQPDNRDHKRNRPKTEDVDAKKKRRPKSAPNDTIMCTTRMKKEANKGRGFSLAAFRLFFLDSS